LSTNGTASQSSDYNWTARNVILTADLAISGTDEDTFDGEACSVTLFHPTQYKAWWMLTFPVDTVYITNVQIYYRGNSEYVFHIHTFSGTSSYLTHLNIIHRL
jgi:hypothetical protein